MFTGVSRSLFFFLQLKTAADSGHGRRNGSKEPTSCGFCAPSFPFFSKKEVFIGMANKDSLSSHYFSIKTCDVIDITLNSRVIMHMITSTGALTECVDAFRSSLSSVRVHVKTRSLALERSSSRVE